MFWHKKSKSFLLKSNIPGRSVSGVPQFVDKSLWKSYGGILLFHNVPDQIHSISSTWSSRTIPHRCHPCFYSRIQTHTRKTPGYIMEPFINTISNFQTYGSPCPARLQRRRNSDLCLWWNQQPCLCLSPRSWWSSPAMGRASPRGFGEGSLALKHAERVFRNSD